MDVRFLNPVITSTLDVLSTMAHLDPIPGQPMTKERNQVVQGKAVTGLMSMVGKKRITETWDKKVVASIGLTFSEAAILHIAQKMLPPGITTIDGMVLDLAGELANMVLGGAKRKLEEKGFFFQMSLPTIIFGHDYLIAHKTKSPIILLPFAMLEGDFFVEVSYDEDANGGQTR